MPVIVSSAVTSFLQYTAMLFLLIPECNNNNNNNKILFTVSMYLAHRIPMGIPTITKLIEKDYVQYHIKRQYSWIKHTLKFKNILKY